MDANKREHMGTAKRSSSDTESESQANVAMSSSTLEKRVRNDALISANGKEKRKKAKPIQDLSDAMKFEASLVGADQIATVLTDDNKPIEIVITREEAAGLNAAVAASAELVNELQHQTPPLKPRKGRRVRKTNLEKMEILAFVDQGGSQGAAAEKFGVSRTAVTKMVKERAAISAQALVESATSSRKVLQYQHKLSIIEDMLHKWQMQVELDAPALKVTGELLQSKAMEFRNKILADYCSELSDDVVLSLTDFKASNGWLHRYMQRRSMRSLPKHHSRISSTTSEKLTVDQRVQKIRDVLINTAPNCIWCLDELTLRHRTTSIRPDTAVNMDARSLEGISVALAVSAMGEKLHLQVVGKNPMPESMKDVDTLTTYGVYYREQYRATHDASTIVHFIQAMNHEAMLRKQVWFVVLDSCTAHVAAAHSLTSTGSFQNGFRFDSMVLLFLPPGPTSEAQPLHQGIFRFFKLRFRQEMLQTLLYEYEQYALQSHERMNENIVVEDALGTEVFDIHAHTDMRNTLSWLHVAWEIVPASLIRHAWATSLYSLTLEPGDDDVSAALVREEMSKAYAELFAQLTKVSVLQKILGLELTATSNQLMEELLELDKSDTSGAQELVKDNEIVVESLAAQGLLRDTSNAVGLERIKGDDLPVLTPNEANVSVCRLLHYMSQDTLLTLSERRTGRTNLLLLQRLLLKARERERERDTTTDFTV
ncbi:hypothetical protein CCR75_001594 [Bremia lactucae]|uniref:HTH CENPB-type domain-containing protein n=1 Tax=Bremia lactucae TaxID=4779 RepID=A0A976ICY8_BRELC|nr:hypothetical protein CCR75_001594 [Bremia lactucae]